MNSVNQMDRREMVTWMMLRAMKKIHMMVAGMGIAQMMAVEVERMQILATSTFKTRLMERSSDFLQNLNLISVTVVQTFLNILILILILILSQDSSPSQVSFLFSRF